MVHQVLVGWLLVMPRSRRAKTSCREVNTILDHWDFPPEGIVAGNFSGSGTNLLAALERGFHRILAATSVDSAQVPPRLSLAFTASRTRCEGWA